MSRHTRGIFGLSLLLNLLLSLALFDPKPYTGGDNAGYVILAESILRRGDGYSDTIGPEPPQPYTLYPFGYPLLLAPLLATAGRNQIVLKSLSLALTIGSVALFSLLLRGLVPPVPWAGLSLAVAVNPVIVEYAHWVLSEAPFLFFSLLSLALLIGAGTQSRPWTGATFWLGLLAGGFTAHIRTIGWALPIAGVASLALRRRWRALAISAIGISCLLAPWAIRNRMVERAGASPAEVGAGEGSYTSQLLLKDPYAPELGKVGPGDLAARLFQNVRTYSGPQMARVLLGMEAFLLPPLAGEILAVAASALVLLGFLLRLTREVGICEVYVAVFGGVVLLWPETWSDVRFIMPLVPLILLYLAEGAGWVAGLFRRSAAPYAAAGAACLVVILSLGAQAREMPANFRMLSQYFHGDRYAGYPDNWRHFFEAGDWIREHTAESSVITVRKRRSFYLHTGRRVKGYPFTADADSVLREILGSDYVVVDAVSATTDRYLIPAIQRAPGRFHLVYLTKEPYTAVLKVVR